MGRLVCCVDYLIGNVDDQSVDITNKTQNSHGRNGSIEGAC